MSNMCPYCGRFRNVCVSPVSFTYICLACEKIFRKGEQPKQTVFHRITASPKVLAEKLVYKTYDVIVRTWDTDKDNWGTAEPTWKSVIINDECNFSTREDAVAATVAKLKEVEK